MNIEAKTSAQRRQPVYVRKPASISGLCHAILLALALFGYPVFEIIFTAPMGEPLDTLAHSGGSEFQAKNFGGGLDLQASRSDTKTVGGIDPSNNTPTLSHGTVGYTVEGDSPNPKTSAGGLAARPGQHYPEATGEVAEGHPKVQKARTVSGQSAREFVVLVTLRTDGVLSRADETARSEAPESDDRDADAEKTAFSRDRFSENPVDETEVNDSERGGNTPPAPIRAATTPDPVGGVVPAEETELELARAEPAARKNRSARTRDLDTPRGPVPAAQSEEQLAESRKADASKAPSSLAIAQDEERIGVPRLARNVVDSIGKKTDPVEPITDAGDTVRKLVLAAPDLDGSDAVNRERSLDISAALFDFSESEGPQKLTNTAPAPVSNASLGQDAITGEDNRFSDIIDAATDGDMRFATALSKPQTGVASAASNDPDRERRIRVLRSAAEEGYDRAQFALARQLIIGEQPQATIRDAIELLRDAAERGHVEAQLLLGVIFAQGQIAPRDLVESQLYFTLAEAQGVSNVKPVIDEIERKLTVQEIISARNLGREYRRLVQSLNVPQAYGRGGDGLRDDLLDAAAAGNTAEIARALARGVDIETRDNSGRTAVINAAWRGRVDAMELLLEVGANINTRDNDGLTALAWAASNGHAKVVDFLIAANADLDAEDEDGTTALMRAAWNGHASVVDALILAGASLGSTDRHGRSALDYAWRGGNNSVVESLRSASI